MLWNTAHPTKQYPNVLFEIDGYSYTGSVGYDSSDDTLYFSSYSDGEWFGAVDRWFDINTLEQCIPWYVLDGMLYVNRVRAYTFTGGTEFVNGNSTFVSLLLTDGAAEDVLQECYYVGCATDAGFTTRLQQRISLTQAMVF